MVDYVLLAEVWAYVWIGAVGFIAGAALLIGVSAKFVPRAPTELIARYPVILATGLVIFVLGVLWLVLADKPLPQLLLFAGLGIHLLLVGTQVHQKVVDLPFLISVSSIGGMVTSVLIATTLSRELFGSGGLLDYFPCAGHPCYWSIYPLFGLYYSIGWTRLPSFTAGIIPFALASSILVWGLMRITGGYRSAGLSNTLGLIVLTTGIGVGLLSAFLWEVFGSRAGILAGSTAALVLTGGVPLLLNVGKLTKLYVSPRDPQDLVLAYVQAHNFNISISQMAQETGLSEEEISNSLNALRQGREIQ